MEKRLLTIEETAEYLNTNKAKLYQLVHAYGFPSLRVGSRWRVDLHKLDKWIDQQTKRKDSECLPSYF